MRTRGEGVQNPENFVDVIYGRPLAVAISEVLKVVLSIASRNLKWESNHHHLMSSLVSSLLGCITMYSVVQINMVRVCLRPRF